MKADEAPEKIWLGKSTQNLMLFDPNSNTYVEYTRTDAFIEKACDWLEMHINDYLVKGRDIDYMFDDFHKAMGEYGKEG